MDKNAIKKYAVWARNELIERVSQKADQYEISADADPNADAAHGVLLTPSEKKQRISLITKVKDKGMDQVIEEVAYTWFNRFAALRFMEVNNYLPSKVRVFTDNEGAFKPEILAEAIHLEMEGLDMEKVYALKDTNDNEALFKYLIITQCNTLSKVLPGMFQKIADYTELLFPDNQLREGSVIEQMVTTIPEADWKDQVQIIGWLYQYYNTEPKDKVFADLKKNKKITKEKIPAATQVFTPDWIVRYMVENSLGRLWIEGHPNDDLKASWKYYLDEAKQEPEVQKQLEEIHREYSTLKPEDIRAIDPCMGSGHIICYMFDVLMQIYEAYGYTTRDAVSSIVQNNLYGLDIDERASQLAYFAVMMKACQYDRRFLSRGIQPHVYAIMESNHFDPNMIDFFTDGRKELKAAINSLVSDLHDAKEYGSILDVKPVDFNALYARFDEIRAQNPNMYTYQILGELLPFVQVAEAMSQKYHSVVTNPPYMEISSGSSKLVDFVNNHYIGGKTDMFAVFIERAELFAENFGYIGMITQPSLTSLVSFEKIRSQLFTQKTFSSFLHMGRGIFGIDFGSVSFVFRNMHIGKYAARYFKLYERTFQYINPDDIKTIFLYAKENENYKFDFEQYDTESGVTKESSPQGNQIAFVAKQDQFLLVPGIPFAYTMSEQMIEAFSVGVLGNCFVTREGMATADNDEFLRMWYEVKLDDISFNCKSSEEAVASRKRWFPYNKGGDYRKWYGNNDYVVDWENDGYRIRNNKDPRTGRIRSHNYNGEYSFRSGLTWSSISAGDISIRWSDPGFLFDSKGAKGFASDESAMYAILGFLNSTTAMRYLKVISPTMDFKVGDIIQLPLNPGIFNNEELQSLVKDNISLMRKEWNSRETSWEFEGFPLNPNRSIREDIEKYIFVQQDARNRLKDNEERINSIIASIYGLLEETRCDVPDDKLSIVPVDKNGAVKQLIAFAVGCMFGRYSLDVKGIAYAGGEWDSSKYKTFMPDKDAIIPITDDDYFTDDIVGRFVEFLKRIYGESKLDENLNFVAGALEEKGSTSREIIRNYFLNDFFKEHCNAYSITGSGKRPIYWLFDSGRKNGFKCLVYMHRYQPDTIARIRTDYVHEQQARYRTAISDLERQINGAPTSERVRLNKQLTKLKDQAEEVRVYEEKIHHLADQMISIDLDDGVKHNYAIFQDVLAKIK